MENVNENEKSSERYHLDDLLIKQSHDENGNVIEGKYDLTLSYGGKESRKEISQEDLDNLLAADQGDKIRVLGSLAGNQDMFTNDNHFTIESMVTEEITKMELGFEDPQKEEWMKNHLSGSSNAKEKGYYLDDFNIKQSHDENGNVIEGKYDLTLSYDGKEVVKEIDQKALGQLLDAKDEDKIKVLGSLAGNEKMFTNTDHGRTAMNVNLELLDFSEQLKGLGDSEARAVGNKLVVTGQNLDSLSINKASDGLYTVNMKFDGSSNLMVAIDQKTFDKLQTLGDYQRAKILGNLFPEVEFRLDADEQRKVGQMILDETQAITKKAEEGNVLDPTKERSEAIGAAASRYFEDIYQEENRSQSVNRGIGM